jgi:hypothetical protein
VRSPAYVVFFPLQSCRPNPLTITLGASVYNMYEMFALARRHNRKQSPQISSPLLNSDMMSQAASWESLDEAIDELQTMKRKDLITLFLDCEHPDINDLAVTSEKTNEDDWVYDGYLLDNGPILVRDDVIKVCVENHKQPLHLEILMKSTMFVLYFLVNYYQLHHKCFIWKRLEVAREDLLLFER